MSRFVLLLVVVLACVYAKNADQTVATLKNKVLSKSTATFQLNKNDVFAKVSKIGKKVQLSQQQQRTVWSKFLGASKGVNFDSFAGTEEGIMLSKNGAKVRCKQDRGKETKAAFVVHFNCDSMRFKTVAKHPAGDMTQETNPNQDHNAAEGRTHPTLHNEKDQPNVHEGTYGGDPDFNTRVRFWHRAANGPYNGLSLSKRYKFTAVDSQGYYGCSQLTSNGYCMESFRHEWMEFNPNDLPFTVNPPNPCLQANCDQQN